MCTCGLYIYVYHCCYFYYDHAVVDIRVGHLREPVLNLGDGDQGEPERQGGEQLPSRQGRAQQPGGQVLRLRGRRGPLSRGDLRRHGRRVRRPPTGWWGQGAGGAKRLSRGRIM